MILLRWGEKEYKKMFSKQNYKYYLLDKDGTRLTDEDGNYLEPVSLDEAKEAVAEGEADDYEEADRFLTKQGY